MKAVSEMAFSTWRIRGRGRGRGGGRGRGKVRGKVKGKVRGKVTLTLSSAWRILMWEV